MAAPTGGSKQDSMSDKACCSGWGKCGSGVHFGKKLIKTFVGILLVYGIVYLGTLIHSNMKKYDFIGKADRMEKTITINGTGKVTGSNDIAVTTMGYSNTDKDVSKAQADNKAVMDKIYAALKQMGIADKDLQSDYSILPDYNYTQTGGQILNGYKVSNSLTIKIRDLSKIGTILSLAGQYGATEVGGLNFTIDDPENLKIQARDKALLDAKVKAEHLANVLGLQLSGVVTYTEYEGGGTDYPMMAAPMMKDGGANVGSVPTAISSGSRDEVMNVSVTYEVL